jgi:prepilin-type N-terminal cleavage/methylation domain-containing protein
MDATFAMTATGRANKSAGRRPADWPATVRHSQWPSDPRRGFTLVEMLTVVVIIGILASLVTGAVIAAKRKAIIALTGIELNEFDRGLKAYKEGRASYPPDFAGIGPSNPAAVRDRARWAVIRHLETAFPRYRVPGTTLNEKWTNLTTRLLAYGVILDDLDPSAALVFWLGGLPDGAGSTRLIGFSANVQDPFYFEDLNKNNKYDPGQDQLGSRLPALFEFKPERLKLVDGVLRYFPDIGGSGENAPYVYFRAGSGMYGFRAQDGTYVPHPGFASTAHPEWGATGPCRDTRVPLSGSNPPFDWANRDSFQTRAAGLDGIFGTGVLFPAGDDYDTASFDDQTNFSAGTLEDKM